MTRHISTMTQMAHFGPIMRPRLAGGSAKQGWRIAWRPGIGHVLPEIAVKIGQNNIFGGGRGKNGKVGTVLA
jgi:hypothetical protein